MLACGRPLRASLLASLGRLLALLARMEAEVVEVAELLRLLGTVEVPAIIKLAVVGMH